MKLNLKNILIFLTINFNNKNISFRQSKNLKIYNSIKLNNLSLIFKNNNMRDSAIKKLFRSAS